MMEAKREMKRTKIIKIAKPKEDLEDEGLKKIVKEIKNGWVFNPDKGWRLGQ